MTHREPLFHTLWTVIYTSFEGKSWNPRQWIDMTFYRSHRSWTKIHWEPPGDTLPPKCIDSAPVINRSERRDGFPYSLSWDKVWAAVVFYQYLHFSNPTQSEREMILVKEWSEAGGSCFLAPWSFQRGSSLLQREILGVCTTRSWWLNFLCASAWTGTQAFFFFKEEP